MVRKANHRDLSSMVAFVRSRHEGSIWGQWSFSPGALRKNLKGMLGRPGFEIFIAEQDDKVVGILVAMVDQLLWSRTLYATDIVFLADRQGTELIQAFRQWAKEAGASVILMGVTEAGREQAKERWFQTQGLERTGGMFMEKLK